MARSGHSQNATLPVAPLHSSEPFVMEEPGDREKASGALRQLEGSEHYLSANYLLAKQEPHLIAVYEGAPRDSDLIRADRTTPPGKTCYSVSGQVRFGIVVSATPAGTTGRDPQIKTYVFSGCALRAFQPRFSPDGRYIAFILGWPGEFYLNTRLYLLDTQTETLQQISDTHTYISSYEWSPDSQYLAFTANGIYSTNSPFGTDGTHPEGFSPIAGDMTLVAYDILKGQNEVVAHAGAALGLWHGYAWDDVGNLLFTRNITPKAGFNSAKGERFGVYTWCSSTKKTQLVAADAQRPYPVSDGQWIAFVGKVQVPVQQVVRTARSKSKQHKIVSRPRSTVRFMVRAIKRDGSGLKFLNAGPITADTTFFWREDSEHLIVANGALIMDWDVVTGVHHSIEAAEAQRESGYIPHPRFTLDNEFIPNKLD